MTAKTELSAPKRHTRAEVQEQSRPLLGVIGKQIEDARSVALPGGAPSKAGNYALTLGGKLRSPIDSYDAFNGVAFTSHWNTSPSGTLKTWAIRNAASKDGEYFPASMAAIVCRVRPMR